MLVAWRYRNRPNSLIQQFDPRAWLIFYACFLFGTISFWDVRFLLPFLIFALITLFTSGVKWHEIRRSFLFILGFVFFFAILTFLTGRGGVEHYQEEHLIRQFKASFSILGYYRRADFLCLQSVSASIQPGNYDHPDSIFTGPEIVWDHV